MKPHLLLFGFLLATVSMQAKNYNSPYGFYENKGQIIDQNNNLNPSVKYLWTGNGMKVQLKGNSFSYEVLKVEKFEYRNPKHKVMLSLSKHRKAAFDDSTIIYSHRVDIELLNSNPHPQIIAEEKSADYDNYYTTGTPEEGVTFVYHYSKVTYKDIYPNIDLEFVSDAKNEKGFKYNFIVRPGGNVADIQLKYKGANKTQLQQDGSVAVQTSYGELEENIPLSYEAETGNSVQVKYRQIGKDIYGLLAIQYNHLQTLVIDPWGTYLGVANGAIGGTGVAVDNSRNSIICGSTNATNNVATTGSYQTIYGGGISDVFIMKFNANGTNKLWSTYYGGNDDDEAYGITSDSFNNIYVTGITLSANSIATTGAHDTVLPVGFSSFLVKFNTNGIRQWGTYYPAQCSKVVADKNGDVYIVGNAANNILDIVTLNAYQNNFGGGSFDAFIAKFNSSGLRLWGTYYGGNGDDYCSGISIDNSGNIAISGYSNSSNNIASNGCYQSIIGGLSDAFIAKFNSFGIRQWGTYYGGVGDDYGNTTITFNISGDIFLTGWAGTSIFFATTNAFQTSLSGGNDCFLAQFNANGIRQWGTYFGGNDDDNIWGTTTDIDGNVIFCGETRSINNIASPNAYQTVKAGDYDGFIEKFTQNGTRVWGTYYGSNGSTIIDAITSDNIGEILITGSTSSTAGITTIGTYQPTLLGAGDGFLASFDSSGHLTTGIVELSPKLSILNVYPNPAKDKITVSIKEYAGKGGSLVLTDIEGKAVKSVVVKSAECSIDVKDLAAGVYLLQYEDGEVCETVKVVKE